MFPTQGSNPGRPNYRHTLLTSEPPGRHRLHGVTQAYTIANPPPTQQRTRPTPSQAPPSHPNAPPLSIPVGVTTGTTYPSVSLFSLPGTSGPPGRPNLRYQDLAIPRSRHTKISRDFLREETGAWIDRAAGFQTLLNHRFSLLNVQQGSRGVAPFHKP